MAPLCRPPHYRHPGPGPPFLHNSSTPSSSSSSSTSSATTISLTNTSTSPNLDHPYPDPTRPAAVPAELPDEVLVSIFRFIDHASKLATLRTVCRQWCKVIDDTPDVWRAVSFKNAHFYRPVVLSDRALTLGPRVGHNAVSIAARSGNEWARFLKAVVFDRRTLRAVTIPQPIASLLVSGERPVESRPFPPWVGDHPDVDGTWVAIHAARRTMDVPDDPDAVDDPVPDPALPTDGHPAATPPVRPRDPADPRKLPRGAMVGMIHVRDAFHASGPGNGTSTPNWIWRIDRAVSLKKPIRCAGFIGLWSISGFLTDLLVNAMHSQ